MAGILDAANLRTKLTTIAPGVTVSAVQYPDGTDALPAVVAFLRAVEEQQTEQNAAAPVGEDVQAISIGYGAEETVTINGNPVKVRRATRTVSCYEKNTVSEVYPILV